MAHCLGESQRLWPGFGRSSWCEPQGLALLPKAPSSQSGEGQTESLQCLSAPRSLQPQCSLLHLSSLHCHLLGRLHSPHRALPLSISDTARCTANRCARRYPEGDPTLNSQRSRWLRRWHSQEQMEGLEKERWRFKFIQRFEHIWKSKLDFYGKNKFGTFHNQHVRCKCICLHVLALL